MEFCGISVIHSNIDTCKIIITGSISIIIYFIEFLLGNKYFTLHITIIMSISNDSSHIVL